MTDADLVLERLALLRRYVGRARRRLPESVERLVGDEDLQDALAMSLLVSIQQAIDIAFHIVTDESWGLPKSYGDAFKLLAENGVIAPDLADRLALAAAFRNRLAHGYASVDVPRLFRESPGGLDDLDALASAVAAFLERRAP